MPAALEKTFHVLSHTTNSSAIPALMLGLESRRSPTGVGAARALCQTQNVAAFLEVLKRWDFLPEHVRHAFQEHPDRLAEAINLALVQDDSELRRTALHYIQIAQAYGHFPRLLEMLSGENYDQHELAAHTIRVLVNQLWDHLHEPAHSTENRDSHSERRAAPCNSLQIRNQLLEYLDSACKQISRYSCPEVLVESVLILGDPSHFVLKNVLFQYTAQCAERVLHLLRSSTHPGVMSLVTDFMAENYPPIKMLETVEMRSDVDFISHLLRWLPSHLTANQSKNLREIKKLSWLNHQRMQLELVPKPLQSKLYLLLNALGMDSELRQNIREWLLRHGSVEGRLAAGETFGSLDVEKRSSILSESLESDDEQIQAWATRQLRAQGIPEAWVILLRQLDSSLPAVREAAQDELKSFDILRFLSMFNEVEPHLHPKVGALLRKIDSTCAEKLHEELFNSIRFRRLRAVQAVFALKYEELMLNDLLNMLNDEEALIRRTVAEGIANFAHPEVVQKLTQLLADPSVRVREVAANSLQKIYQQNPSLKAIANAPVSTLHY